jgi:hypothetical protein
MKEAETAYGFNLLKVQSKKYKSGFYYAVRYKDFNNKKWLSTKTSTNTDNEIIAKTFSIENREKIITHLTQGFGNEKRIYHRRPKNPLARGSTPTSRIKLEFLTKSSCLRTEGSTCGWWLKFWGLRNMSK